MFRKYSVAILLFTGCITLVAFPFLRSCDYGIVDLDDYAYLLSHPEIIKWAGWDSIAFSFSSVEEGIWMPLTWLSYALDYKLFSDWYGGFHIHSLFVHAVNAYLVWIFLCCIFYDANSRGQQFLCFVGALIWAVHPLRCESVVFLSSRKDVLSFFWEIMAFICWVIGTRQSKVDNHGDVKYTAIATVFFVVASMCKPSVMTFPILCLLIDMFIYKEVRLLRYIAPVSYMLFLGGFTIWQQNLGGATLDSFGQPLWGRILGAMAAFGIYIRNFAWPQWLAPQCIKTWPQMPRFLIPGILISCIWGWYLCSRACRYWMRKNEFLKIDKLSDVPVRVRFFFDSDFPMVGAAWFAIAIAPMLGIANFGYHSFADRFTYIPSVGLSIILIDLARRFSWRKGRIASMAVGVLAVAMLSGRTWHQTGYWENDYKLFSHTIEVDGEHNGAAHGILANWYFEFPHDLESCVREFDKARERDINYLMPCYNVFIIALGESGQSNRIGHMLNLYQKEVERQIGPERAREVWNNGQFLSKIEQFYRSMFYSCKLAWALSEEVDLRYADTLVAELKGEGLDDDPIWLYLFLKYHALSGNQEEVDRLKTKLLDPIGKVGYIRFRYAKEIGFGDVLCRHKAVRRDSLNRQDYQE